MDAIPIHPFIFPALVTLCLLWWFLKPGGKKSTVPPSPPKLPILGNLHQLSELPHQDLHVLARKYGPLMLLHLGRVPVLVVSSAETAREIMTTHDVTFSDRPDYMVLKRCLYGCKDVAFSPYGDYWRRAKGVFVLKLLNNKRVQSFRAIREEETALFVEKIRESAGRPVNLSQMFSELSNDGICRSAFGRKFGDMENGKKFLFLVMELTQLMGAIGIGDYIPWLSWISRVNGFDRRVDMVAKGLDDFLEDVIEESLQANRGKNGENFVDIMLQDYNVNTANDRDIIKGIILDAFIAGTETTSVALQWTMAELLRHPTVMEKLQNEVREGRQHITEKDLEEMDFLKAVIKESLRCHPPVPLLVPRIARQDANVNGYNVSAGTMVMVNAWAIGRDPASWDEPEKFKPERFFNSSIDFKGLDFELIPFGAGRRGCPGIAYSVATMELLLANLVHEFSWKLPDGAQGKDLDMNEKPGMTSHKAVPLLAVATKAA